MFYLKYDDIEGLFREAAENYQIDPDKAFDWDKINRSIHDEPGEEDKPESEKNKKRKFILWFFLLLSIGLLSYNIWIIESRKRSLEQNNLQGNKLSANAKKDNISLAQNESDSLSQQQMLSNKNKSASPSTNMRGASPEESITENLQKNNYASINGNIQDKEIHPEIKPVPISKKDVENNQSRSNDKNIPNLIEPLIDTSAIHSPKNNIEKNNGSKFYAGAFVAPDVTFIKFQQSNGVGVTFGLTVGYQFNKNWSIESGISLDTKKYYTKGEYFDKSNVPDFNNAQLLSVSGSCNMLEMPINLRYKFPSNADHNWTTAIGTSSYFITKESYNYSATTGGQNVQGKLINYPSSTHLFAVINISAGYEKKFSNLSLLIEPYYKVPIKGIGTGNLYMSSGGINIGVKKYFGKK